MSDRQSLWINGPLPGMNELIAAAKGARGTGRVYSRMKRQWTDAIHLLAKAARLRPLERVRLRFEWRERDRRRDPDNVAAGGRKLVLDGLVAAGVLPGDGWQHVMGWDDSFSVSEAPGVLVILEPWDKTAAA